MEGKSTPPAVHPGITIWVDEIEIEKKREKKNWPGDFFLGGGRGQFCLNNYKSFFLFLD